MSPTTVLLIETKTRLTPNSWSKGIGDGRARNCILGHMAYAEVDLEIYSNEARGLLNDAASRRGFSVSYLFNDAPETTLEDVWELLDEAIMESMAVGATS